MATTRFFHTTDQAESILREGLRESEGSFMIPGRTFRGVWLADDPLDINEGAKGDQVFAVDLPLSPSELDRYEISEEGKGYREWCVPAEIITRGTITLLTEQEVDAIGDERFERRFRSREDDDPEE